MAKKTKGTQAKRTLNRKVKARKRAKERETDHVNLTAARDAAARLTRKTRTDSFARFAEEYEFWLLHGMNFLSSSYNDGLWTPLFPEAYAATFVALDRTVIMRRLLTSYLNPETNRLSPTGTRCLAWLGLKPVDMFDFVFRLRRNQTHDKADGGVIESRKPANPSIWAGIHEALNLVSAGLEAQGRTQGGEFTVPEGGLT